MKPLTVSVVIPAYNEQERIGRTLECLLAQIGEIDEIVVVDNNSTDATAEVVREIQTREPKIRIIAENRPGVFYARRAGFDAARSTVIARLDADTFARPGWARALRDFFASAPVQVGAVTGPLIPYDSPYREKFEKGKLKELEAGLAKRNPGGRAVYDVQMAPGGNMAITRDGWQAVRGLVSERTDIYDDLDLSICVRKAGFTIGVSADMWAETSARRFRTNPFSYGAYMAQLPRTYRAHGDLKQARASYGVVWSNRLVHLWTWLPTRAFDVETGRKSFKQLFRSEEDRIIGRA
ncbi:glycosyltransferase family 2 protein [Rhodococcus sp. D2-41]|uniref:glycosyltransferase family 2 protein n=1 Tax=Speluncibacter jeojiensis TaxID=2710754 RepID=UPI00240EEAB4|nr:glycosyltransferase family 2 protein [Rhodococcus sp. D2-41]MDG3009117.1 glycosyltransferase family 2 protein [Rhodococcus sp. D2-41]